MMKSLTYSVTFSNGRTIAQSLKPDTNGTTLIVGRNEAGKSLNLEMLAYALFGTEALRGAASEYKRLKVEVALVIKGVEYALTRVKSDASISSNGEIIAKGTSPVNLKVREILGFGLGVFKVSNWCAQGDIQVLANMKPTERKQMIDEVSGLTQLDGVFAWVKTQVKELKTQEEGIIENLYHPEAPTSPEELMSREDLQASYDDLEQRLVKIQKAEANVPSRPVALVEPSPKWVMAMPEKPKAPEPLAEPQKPAPALAKDVGGWTEVIVEEATEVLARMPEWLKQKADIDAQLHQLKRRFDPAHFKGYSAEDLEQFRVHHAKNTKIAQKIELQSKGTIECPNCKHEHYIATGLLESFKDVPDTLYDVPLTLDEISTQFGLLDYMNEERELLAEEAKHNLAQPLSPTAYNDYLTFVDVSNQNKAALVSWQEAMARHGEMVERLETQYQASLDDWVTHTKQVTESNEREEEEYKVRLATYKKSVIDYDAQLEARNKALIELDKLPTRDTLNGLRNQLDIYSRAWAAYDALMGKYQIDLERYNKTLARCKQLVNQRESYELAAKALKEVKSRVKGYLVPSLSKVASQLLNQMTGGERAVVEISEDFEIVVDGQSLRTLSGSGKDITNLAIRIALGQVLTHKVMPLMMFDEIDAAMDDTRAQYTWDCIQKITPRIGQVLLVSHKDLSASHRISV